MIFIDCIHVKVRDGQVANRPICVALAVTVDGNRDILGLWAGDGGEGAKYWAQVLIELKNRGVADGCMVVCDGLSGLPDLIGLVWPEPITQTCVVHPRRASFRCAARQDPDEIAKALRPVHTASPWKRRRNGFSSSGKHGARNTQRSYGCRRPAGLSSYRSFSSMRRYAGSCA